VTARLVGMARQATRPGARGSDSDTRADILRSARKSLSENGYRGTTLRGLARGAGVDVGPRLVEMFTTASRSDLVEDLGPTVQRYLTGDLS
jgi:hypothetical protein